MQFTPLGSLREGSIRVLHPDDIEATRERLQASLKRLCDLHDEMTTRAATLAAAIRRADGLRQTMIAQLDQIDGDPDLEPYADEEPGGDDEHSLGWTSAVNQESLGCPSDEYEPTCEDEGAQCDDEGVRDNEDGCHLEDAAQGAGEYTLGWAESDSLTGNLSGGRDDFEPSLGSSPAIDQSQWVHPLAWDAPNRDHDREYQCEGEGDEEQTGEQGENPLSSVPNWPPSKLADEKFAAAPVTASSYSEPAARTGRAGFNPYGNVGELVTLSAADQTGARKAIIDALVDEFDMLALGKPSPFVIATRLATAGLL